MTDGAYEILEREVARALEAWPGIAVTAGDLAAAIARLAGGTDVAAAVTGLRLDELVLAQACARADARALAHFETGYLSKVRGFLARHAAREADDEVRQLLRERLLLPRPDGPPRIADYSGRGSLSGWLRVAALRVASNLRRGERPTQELDDADGQQALAHAAPELVLLEQRFAVPFRAALRDAFLGLDPEERTVLKLHFWDGLTVEQLGPILGVSRATAGRRLIAARRALEAVTIDLLGDRTQAPPSELRSALRVLVSRLDVSLRTLIDDEIG